MVGKGVEEEEGRERKEGMEQGRGKVTEGMGRTGQDMGWGGEGRQRERRKGKGGQGLQPPKQEYLVPPLLIRTPIS